MDGENNGKPYVQMDDLGGKTHHFWKHPYARLEPYISSLMSLCILDFLGTFHIDIQHS